MRVVEKGFSTARDRGNRPKLSYGFVLENTSRRAIVVPSIKISFTDASGHRLEINPDKLRQSAPFILPGQRHGMGGTFGLLAARKARKLEIEIARPLWVPVGTPPSTVNQPELGARFAEVKASKIRAERTRGRMRLTFTVESGYTTALTNPHFTVVFRDRSGMIVGGSDDYIKPDTKLEPGGSTHFFETWEGLPEGTVDQRSQVYIDPF
ncbi:hypothetical protein ACLQ2P_38195 [Actinomadura citrea]|uniref:hypothetical protein n=1 Tax=Actinomadura citrea TaxID=46158 RepID=UPI003CE51B92